LSKAHVISFGCRLNAVESEVMRAQAQAAGLDDAVVINTCAVTGEAVRQARQTIRRIKRDQPDCRIIVSGCAAQTDPAFFAAMSEVDAVIGNHEKLTSAAYRNLPDFGVCEEEKIRVNDIMSVRETVPHMIDALPGHTRAFLQVQNGCDHRCTFCVIPYGRGNSRSVPMGAVVAQARRLVENGYREVVLTGVDATSYGADLPGRPALGTLAKHLLQHVPDIARLRLSSIDSIEADRDLLDLIADEPRFMPHLHLSLQHGDDIILKRMKRRHSRADAIAFCDRLRRLRPDIAFGADLIAGFPTEDAAAFDNSLSVVEACGIAFVHVFPYSARPGTPAARMPQLPRALVKARAARLRARGQEALQHHFSMMIGRRETVLAESNGIGRTANFTAVGVPFIAPGHFGDVVITGVDKAVLTACPDDRMDRKAVS